MINGARAYPSVSQCQSASLSVMCLLGGVGLAFVPGKSGRKHKGRGTRLSGRQARQQS